MVADGLSNREIAARLAISENRVKHHVRRIHAAVGTATREELARKVQEVRREAEAAAAGPRRLTPSSRHT
jgi:DNA-binding CsgD family transcriptional regulator